VFKQISGTQLEAELSFATELLGRGIGGAIALLAQRQTPELTVRGAL
jgi:hypothetical protein